jgi:hypothetical protein
MPIDREQIEGHLQAANAYFMGHRQDAQQRGVHIQRLANDGSLLSAEIADLRRINNGLRDKETAEIDQMRSQITDDIEVSHAQQAKAAYSQRFEENRRINGGSFPYNVPPGLYLIPLMIFGISEWYINFSTFSAMFIPMFAISATLLVAAVFMWASHLHGAYLKQIAEILHPSVERRNVLGRNIAVTISTVLLFAAFATVVWLRWLVISEQLGTNSEIKDGPFGGASSTMIWSRVGPTIVLNFLIWGLGTLYSWALHERVPDLRESYRAFKAASKKLDKKLDQPIRKEKMKIQARYNRLLYTNNVAIADYVDLLERVKNMIENISKMTPA